MEWFFAVRVWFWLLYLRMVDMNEFAELDTAVTQYKDAARNARLAKDDLNAKVAGRKSAEAAEQEALLAADIAEQLQLQKRDAVAALMF